MAPLPARSTLASLQNKYKRGEPITAITSYDYPSAVHVRLQILFLNAHIITYRWIGQVST